jgi:hypothetical protein
VNLDSARTGFSLTVAPGLPGYFMVGASITIYPGNFSFSNPNPGYTVTGIFGLGPSVEGFGKPVAEEYGCDYGGREQRFADDGAPELPAQCRAA